MLIVLNPHSRNGRGRQRWERIRGEVLGRYPSARCVATGSVDALGAVVKEALSTGERVFVAAGGDGTVNTLLNALMSRATPGRPGDRICLGAIGLGSSNDFHKPFRKDKFIDGIPCALDVDGGGDADLGLVELRGRRGEIERRYFIINASVGATASANHFYSKAPDAALRALKRISVTSAILYAGLRTILRYRNYMGNIEDANGLNRATISNLGVCKRPYFSGDFHYGVPYGQADGEFSVALCRDMCRSEMIRTLLALTKGRFEGEKTSLWKSRRLSVRMEEVVPVEVDGEISWSREMVFSVAPRALWLCA